MAAIRKEPSRYLICPVCNYTQDDELGPHISEECGSYKIFCENCEAVLRGSTERDIYMSWESECVRAKKMNPDARRIWAKKIGKPNFISKKAKKD